MIIRPKMCNFGHKKHAIPRAGGCYKTFSATLVSLLIENLDSHRTGISPETKYETFG